MTNSTVALTNLHTSHVEQPEAVKGGIIAILIGLKTPTTTQTRSDVGQKLQFQLNEANSIYN